MSFCVIYPNLHKTKINVCCTFNFYLISTSSYRCFENRYPCNHVNAGAPMKTKKSSLEANFGDNCCIRDAPKADAFPVPLLG